MVTEQDVVILTSYSGESDEIVDNAMTKSPIWIDQKNMAVNALQKMSSLRMVCQ